MADTNAQLAKRFQQMADVMQITGANRFKTVAYERAARALKDLADDVAELSRSEVLAIEGIGGGIADRIGEFVESGKIEEYDALMATVPAGLLDLLEVPGLGAKTVQLLWKEAGVDGIPALKEKLQGESLTKIKGLGPKKLEQMRKNIAFVEQAGGRARLGAAMPLANWFVQQMRRVKGVKNVAFAGSLRRGKETIGDIDILVAAEAEAAASISDAFVKLEVVDEVLAKGDTKTSIRTGETTRRIQVDLRIVAPAHFGAALMYFTGSKEHNVRMRERAISQKLRLNEYGLWQPDGEGKGADAGELVAAESEEAVYEALGLAWIPPELREDRGEIKLADQDALPKLIELKDIGAELHAHTHASDGRWSIRELTGAVMDRNFHTIAITDHSRSQAQASGLSPERLEEQIKEVHAAARALEGRIQVLAGSEVDILADGKLDYPNSLLKELDIVVASPHSALSQDDAKATRRLLKAIENPYVTIIGHPTGRLVNRREGLHPDMKQVYKAAAERGVALEINANHYRLDLRDTHARAALEAGCKLAINTDAHGPADLDQLIYGILTARRAGATANDVVNCMDAKALRKWIDALRP